MLKLSIITINYNNLLGLQKTVASVASQTWQEFEYIVIDGGSTDGSAAYLEEQSAHFDYCISEQDSGIYNAMNKGIAKATGEYLFFLNSGDDFVNCNALKKSHPYLFEKDIIYFNLNISNGVKSYVCQYPKKLSFSYFKNNTLPHPATFIRATLFNKIGLYDESLKIVSDWKFFIKSICKYNCSYIKIDKVLSTFYLDGLSSKSQNKELILNEREEVLKDEFAIFIDDANELNYLRIVVNNLRKSRKIKWLIKLGLIDRF